MADSRLGILNRNIAPGQGVGERVYCITVPEKVGTSAVDHDYRFIVSSVRDCVLVDAQASANSIGGFSAFTIDVSGPSGSFLTAPASMLGKAQQVVPFSLATNLTLTAGQVCWIAVRVTGAEAYSDLMITLRFRPAQGSETRL